MFNDLCKGMLLSVCYHKPDLDLASLVCTVH